MEMGSYRLCSHGSVLKCQPNSLFQNRGVKYVTVVILLGMCMFSGSQSQIGSQHGCGNVCRSFWRSLLLHLGTNTFTQGVSGASQVWIRRTLNSGSNRTIHTIGVIYTTGVIPACSSEVISSFIHSVVHTRGVNIFTVVKQIHFHPPPSTDLQRSFGLWRVLIINWFLIFFEQIGLYHGLGHFLRFSQMTFNFQTFLLPLIFFGFTLYQLIQFLDIQLIKINSPYHNITF